MRIFLCLVLGFSLGACGGDNLATEGQPCSTSGDCAAGLLCNYGPKQPVCATMDTVGRDLSANPHDLSGSMDDMAVAPPDLSGVDLFGVRDMAVPRDLRELPDLSETD